MRQSARYPSSRRQAVASSDEDSVDGLESPPRPNSKQRGMRRTGGSSEEEGHYAASAKPVQSSYDNPYSDDSDESATSSSEDDDVPQETEKKRRSSRFRNFDSREQRLLALGRSNTHRSSASSQGHELSTLSTQGEGGGSRSADSRRPSRSSSTTLAPLVAPSNVSPHDAHPPRRWDKGRIALLIIIVSMILAIVGFVVGMSIKSAIAAQQPAESTPLGVDDSIAR